MKQIGYKVGDAWRVYPDGDDGKSDPTAVYMTETGDLPANPHIWELVGWMLPADAQNGGGEIYRVRQGVNSVAAWVKRAVPPHDTRNPIDEIKRVIAGMSERIDRLEQDIPRMTVTRDTETEHSGKIQFVSGAKAWDGYFEQRDQPTMTFYDFAFIAACIAVTTDEKTAMLKSEALMKAAHSIAAMITAARRPS